jgi:hypothetical protein
VKVVKHETQHNWPAIRLKKTRAHFNPSHRRSTPPRPETDRRVLSAFRTNLAQQAGSAWRLAGILDSTSKGKTIRERGDRRKSWLALAGRAAKMQP